MRKQHPSFCLVGPGKVGSSLGIALARRGWRCVSVLSLNRSGAGTRELKKKFPRATISGSASSLRGDFDLLLITVSDGAIENVAGRLAGTPHLDWRGKVVLHASGIVPVKALEALKTRGASTGAFHPMAAFATRSSPDQSRSIIYDFFGGTPARDMARTIAETLSSKLLTLRSERQRELLHAASVVVSNFTVIGIRAAEELTSGIVRGRDAGNLFDGLLASTFANLRGESGISSLTGPLVRGDIETVTRHLEALESNPLLLQFYKSASLLGVDMLVRKARTPARRRELLKMKKLLLLEG